MLFFKSLTVHFINTIRNKSDNVLAENYSRYVFVKCNSKYTCENSFILTDFSWSERLGRFSNAFVKCSKQLKLQIIQTYDHAFDRKITVTPC